ncbi:MAG: helix-turn-helix domain-containing protein [Erythrobacter sp.]|uniref:winged helix-turn-helix transcriptional regulator n=1 Tax=Erythrobacter sp. TaxID=1042 RepID=UPI002616CC01|nr:helix-turn-helix domain-containing protein [Erythrobacter sp.]MDJ0979340.1 helix-turn-helix domain-containing protein [Erythrobacter sp.]
MGEVRESLRELIDCGLPQALEVMGERWSFMILRASFNGLKHFEEFLSELGIARNILSNRLAKLVEHGILKREPCEDDRRKIEYRLTEKGFDLLPAMIALRQWGQKYGSEFVAEDPVLVDERDRLPIGPVSVLSHDGRILNHTGLNLIKRADVGRRVDGTVAEPSQPLMAGDIIDIDEARKIASN